MKKLEQVSYTSITSPPLRHNLANTLTELILLNKVAAPGEFPWRSTYKEWWGETVSCIRKLMKTFNITGDQIAWYIYKCQPTELNGTEFAKLAVVAKKLFQKYDIEQLHRIYAERYRAGQDVVLYSYSVPKKTKSLSEFIKELESGQKA